jgi:uncharacterized protein (TIGR03382 family)
MMLVLVASLVTSQTYARTRTVEGTPSTPCLYWKERTVIAWAQSTVGNPETPGRDEFEAVGRGFAAWQAALSTCGSLSVEEGPRSSSRRAQYLDNACNENLVLFRHQRCSAVVPRGDPCFADGSCGNLYDCWSYSDSAIAITTTSFDPETGQILDADIELNAPSYFLSTVDGPVCPQGAEAMTCVATDLQSVMTHEVGHLLGLAHVEEPTATMAASYRSGELSKRTIDPGSQRFLCDVYPAGQPSRTCLTRALGTESLSALAPTCRGPSQPPAPGCSTTPLSGSLALSLLLAQRLGRRRQLSREAP